jgi:hypothetical protein
VSPFNTSSRRVVQTPFQAPNCNAYAARFVRAFKEECLNRVIPFGERHFRRWPNSLRAITMNAIIKVSATS